MKRPLLTIALFAALTAAIAAADLTGEWELELDPDFGGVKDVVACTLEQEGEALTANCGGGPNIRGELRGQKVTLLVKTGKSGEYTATFTGELDSRAITVAGTWSLADDRGRREGKFTLRRIGRALDAR